MSVWASGLGRTAGGAAKAGTTYSTTIAALLGDEMLRESGRSPRPAINSWLVVVMLKSEPPLPAYMEPRQEKYGCRIKLPSSEGCFHRWMEEANKQCRQAGQQHSRGVGVG